MRETPTVLAAATTEILAEARREFVVTRIGSARVALDASRVVAVLDGVAGAEPPCDEPWVSGWFVHDERLWLVVRLDGRRLRRGAPTKRVVIRETDGVRFAIEVDEVYGGAVLDHVTRESASGEGWIAPDGWLKRGVAYDGTPVSTVDLDAVAARLAATGV